MKKIILLLLVMPFLSIAQEKGIHFEHGLSWEQVKEKAKKEHKFLFVDCFTTWCGPCKYMSQEVFTQEKVGQFFNQNFVNVKVQFDKTKGDSEEVKKGYADAEMINKSYKIYGYPTFLIFSPEGELVHQITGGSESEEFMSSVKAGLNPDKQYFTLLKKYEAGNRDPEMLKQLAFATEEAIGEKRGTEKYAEAYLATHQEVFTKENLDFLTKFMRDCDGKIFQLLLNNSEKADAILGKGKVNEMLIKTIMRHDLYSKMIDADINIDSLISATRAKHPSIDLDQEIDYFKIVHHSTNKKNVSTFQSAVLAYVKKYGPEIQSEALNNFAFLIFRNCEDPDMIATALLWSKQTVEKTEEKDPYFLNTYARLLYKTGNKKDAISMQNKAITLLATQDENMVTKSAKEYFQDDLNEMKKGKKIWLD